MVGVSIVNQRKREVERINHQLGALERWLPNQGDQINFIVSAIEKLFHSAKGEYF